MLTGCSRKYGTTLLWKFVNQQGTDFLYKNATTAVTNVFMCQSKHNKCFSRVNIIGDYFIIGTHNTMLCEEEYIIKIQSTESDRRAEKII